MKKILLSFAFFFVGLNCCFAQTDAKADCIYSDSGYIVKQGSFKYGNNKTLLKFSGLYNSDEKTCVKCFNSTNDYLVVAPGTEVIARNACNSEKIIYIPKSVKYISPDAFSVVHSIIIYDDESILEYKINKKE